MLCPIVACISNDSDVLIALHLIVVMPGWDWTGWFVS
jgi:hypothetical protein